MAKYEGAIIGVESRDGDAPPDAGAQDVAKQAHYAHGIEPIDYMRSRFKPEEFRGYLRGNVIKYLSRYTDKGGVEDLRKAMVYLQWLTEHEVQNG